MKKIVKTATYNRKTGLGKERDIAVCLSATDWRGLNRNQDQNVVVEIVYEEQNHDKK